MNTTVKQTPPINRETKTENFLQSCFKVAVLMLEPDKLIKT